MADSKVLLRGVVSIWQGRTVSLEKEMIDQQTLRVEIERLDHGYEARVPSVHGLGSVGLTEGETLRRLSDAAALHFQVARVRLEVFRT